MRTTDSRRQPRRGRAFEYRGYWLWKRGDSPAWYIYWCRPGSRRVCRQSTYEHDLEAAKEALIHFVHERSGRAQDAPEAVPIREALNRYVEVTLAGRPSQRTAVDCLERLDRFFDYARIETIAELTMDAQDRYVAWRRGDRVKTKRPIKDATIARELGVLRAALNEYHRRGYVKSVPFVRGMPASPPRQRVRSREEIARLLKACEPSPHLWRYTMVALHTLQRPTAILELTCDRVDLERGRVDFQDPARPPSNKRRPVVPISGPLRPVLAAALGESRSGRVIEYRGKPCRCIRKGFVDAARSVGLLDVSPYTLRHSAATLLVNAGVSLWEVGGMLGHSQSRTTELYAKHQPDYLAGARAVLDDLTPPAPSLTSTANTPAAGHRGRSEKSTSVRLVHAATVA